MLTLIEAAYRLNIKPATLRKWVQKKLISHYRYPKKTSRPRFKLEDLDKFKEGHRVEAKREAFYGKQGHSGRQAW